MMQIPAEAKLRPTEGGIRTEPLLSDDASRGIFHCVHNNYKYMCSPLCRTKTGSVRGMFVKVGQHVN